MRETDFKEYKEIGEVLFMLDEVWQMVQDWEENKKKWETSNIFQMKISEIEDQYQLYQKKLTKNVKILNKIEPIPNGTQKILEELNKGIKLFKVDLEILQCLCQEGMKQRHWMDINQYFKEKKVDLVIDVD